MTKIYKITFKQIKKFECTVQTKTKEIAVTEAVRLWKNENFIYLVQPKVRVKK